MNIKVFWYDGVSNVGDMLSKPILEHFGFNVERVDRTVGGKMLAVGSILRALRQGDTVWGSGLITDMQLIAPRGTTFLAVRGPMTRERIIRGIVPEIYGDPGLLMPLVYNPAIEPKYEIGVIPHYVDKPLVNIGPDQHFIDVQGDYKTVINEIKACRKIISSSLHGIVLAEAYGIPAVWTKYSNNIIGGQFKFQDYFLGTGRGQQVYNLTIPPIKDLSAIQDRLIKALRRIQK